jgi:hypothetical protein
LKSIGCKGIAADFVKLGSNDFKRVGEKCLNRRYQYFFVGNTLSAMQICSTYNAKEVVFHTLINNGGSNGK